MILWRQSKRKGQTRRPDLSLFIHSAGGPEDRDYIEYAHSDAQIIAAWYIEHGAEVVK